MAPSDVVTITGVVKAVPAADQSGEKPRKDLDHFLSFLSFFLSILAHFVLMEILFRAPSAALNGKVVRVTWLDGWFLVGVTSDVNTALDGCTLSLIKISNSQVETLPGK